MPSTPHGAFSHEKVPRARLDSWKEIADYLNKGERTAKRWESERSLPVHHVPGGGHGSVYAFREELDEWLLSERPKEANPALEPAEPSHGNAVVPIRPSANHAPVNVDAPLFPSRKWSRLPWRAAPYALLTIAVVLVFTHFVNLHATQRYTSFLYSLLTSAKSESQTSTSDSEKQLAHELYLRGRFEWNRRTPESLTRALDFFTQSIVHDSTNAESYVGLADTYNLLREYTLMPESEAYKRAIAAARKAVELDDSLAEAHRSLAFDEVWGNWDFVAGEREFKRAIELNPRDPIAHLWFANSFSSPGWYSVCLREIDRAQELDPSSHAILADKGLMLFHAGQVQPALELLQQVELADPEFLSPHRYLASIYLHLRRYPEFLEESERTAELSGDRVLTDNIAAARAGFDREGASGLLHDLYLSQERSYREGKLAGTFLAITCAHMGKKAEAIQLLREEYNKHSAPFLMLRDHPELVTLKEEPGYQELLRKVQAPMPPAPIDTMPATPSSDPRSPGDVHAN